MSILKWVKRNTDRFFFALLRRILRSRLSDDTGPVLLVRTDGIGDLVFFLQYVKSLRSAFSNRQVVLVSRPDPARLAEAVGMFDRVIPYGYKQYRWNYAYRLAILSKIRRLRPSTVLYLSYHREHIGDEMTLLSGASITLAFSGNDEVIQPIVRLRNNRMYHHIIDVPDHVHESERYHAVLAFLGGKSADLPRRESAILTAALRKIAHEPPKPFLPFEEDFCVIGAGGSAPLRRWPAERFAVVADSIASKTGCRIVLCGGRAERRLLGEIREAMKRPATVIDDQSILIAAKVISRARLFIGNESGLLHIAASLGVPTVGILGGGHFSRYFPYGSALIVNHRLSCYECNWHCPFPEPYCLTEISVEQVMGIVNVALSEKP